MRDFEIIIQREMRKSYKEVYSFIISALICLIAPFIYQDVTNVGVLSIMFVICFFLMRNLFSVKSKQLIMLSGIFSILNSITFILGGKIIDIYQDYFLPFNLKRDLLNIILLAVPIFLIVTNVLNLCKNYNINFTSRLKVETKRDNLILWSVFFITILIFWIPFFLIYYPGCLTVDSIDSIKYAFGTRPFSNHHPIIFTMFVYLFIKIGQTFNNVNLGVALFSFIQMIIVDGIISYSILWLMKKTGSKIIAGFVIFYFISCPIFAVYSITMWKDILFSGFMLVFFLYMYDLVESDGEVLLNKEGKIRFIILSLLISFFRNNGFYIIVGMSFIILLLYRIKLWKKIIVPIILIMVTIPIIQGPIYDICGIKKTEIAESLGIPLQQIARAVKYNGKITKEQGVIINNIIPINKIVEAYTPYSSDGVKFSGYYNESFVSQNKYEVLRVWAQMLVPNLGEYLKAYIMETCGYWHIGTKNWIVSLDGLDIMKNPYNIHPDDKLMKYFGIDLKDNLQNKYSFFSIAGVVWIIFLCSIILIIKGQSKYIICLMPFIILWVTLMIATPTYCEFRYMFSFILVAPFVIITTLGFKDKKIKIIISKESNEN